MLLATACDVAPPQEPGAAATPSAPATAAPPAGVPVPEEPDEGPVDDGATGDGATAGGAGQGAGGGAAGAADAVVRPGSDVAAIVDGADAGDRIRFMAGVYRGVEIVPKDGMTFVADGGVVLRGSTPLDGFARQGGRWVAAAQRAGDDRPAQGEEWGFCDDGRDACVQPEDLFVDGAPLTRVTSVSQVREGTWYFDTAAGRVHLGQDPAGHRVELGTTRYAFHGDADDVTIDGFTIEHYATPGRQGAINPRVGRVGAAGTGWTVANNRVRHNHGWGVKIEAGMRLVGNVLRGNGQGGVGGVADDVLIEGNDVVDNCTAGFRCFGWEGGGLKLHGDDITVRGNTVRANLGHGIHTDIGCDRAVIRDNVVTDNQGAGIHHEISGSAQITGNTVRGNGFRPTGASEPGILVLNSHDVTVRGNTVEANARAVVLRQDRRTDQGILRTVTVSGNDVTLDGAGSVVVAKEDGVDAPGWSQGVTFADNTYQVSSAAGQARPFTWRGTAMTIDEWRGTGHDTGSDFVTGG